MNRRDLLRGGLVAAATVPWLTETSAGAALHDTCPTVGYRIFAPRDRVFGVGLWHVARPGKAPSDAQSMDLSQRVIQSILKSSLRANYTDVSEDDIRQANNVAPSVLNGLEEEAKDLLKGIALYLIVRNPWSFWLGLGAAATVILVPYIQGFRRGETQSEAAVDLFSEVITGG